MNPLESLYVKRLCPYCIQEFYPGDCRIVSTLHPGTQIEPAPKGLRRHSARLNPEPLDGPKYVKELACRECPHCSNLLPYNIERVDNVNIAVVGDTFSGKSHYIAAFIHQIREGLLSQGADGRYVRFECLSQEIEDKYMATYYEPLFQNKRMLNNTQPAFDPIREPLIYELVIRESRDHAPRKMNLTIYDASGEDHADQKRLVEYSQYILRASAIIFLADPIAMPKIFAELPAHLQTNIQGAITNRRVASVLNNVIRIYERNNRLEPGARLAAVPVAITLPKSDLLKLLRPISQPYGFLDHPTYNGTVNLRDLASVDQEVRELLKDFGDPNLLLATSTLSKVGFFATSATGFSPNADGTYPDVVPCRCLDPVLWILHKLHYIKASHT